MATVTKAQEPAETTDAQKADVQEERNDVNEDDTTAHDQSNVTTTSTKQAAIDGTNDASTDNTTSTPAPSSSPTSFVSPPTLSLLHSLPHFAALLSALRTFRTALALPLITAHSLYDAVTVAANSVLMHDVVWALLHTSTHDVQPGTKARSKDSDGAQRNKLLQKTLMRDEEWLEHFIQSPYTYIDGDADDHRLRPFDEWTVDERVITLHYLFERLLSDEQECLRLRQNTYADDETVDANELRHEPIGFDDDGFAYYHFGGDAWLFCEHRGEAPPAPARKPVKKRRRRGAARAESDDEEDNTKSVSASSSYVRPDNHKSPRWSVVSTSLAELRQWIDSTRTNEENSDDTVALVTHVEENIYNPIANTLTRREVEKRRAEERALMRILLPAKRSSRLQLAEQKKAEEEEKEAKKREAEKVIAEARLQRERELARAERHRRREAEQQRIRDLEYQLSVHEAKTDEDEHDRARRHQLHFELRKQMARSQRRQQRALNGESSHEDTEGEGHDEPMKLEETEENNERTPDGVDDGSPHSDDDDSKKPSDVDAASDLSERTVRHLLNALRTQTYDPMEQHSLYSSALVRSYLTGERFHMRVKRKAIAPFLKTKAQREAEKKERDDRRIQVELLRAEAEAERQRLAAARQRSKVQAELASVTIAVNSSVDESGTVAVNMTMLRAERKSNRQAKKKVFSDEEQSNRHSANNSPRNTNDDSHQHNALPANTQQHTTQQQSHSSHHDLERKKRKKVISTSSSSSSSSSSSASSSGDDDSSHRKHSRKHKKRNREKSRDKHKRKSKSAHHKHRHHTTEQHNNNNNVAYPHAVTTAPYQARIVVPQPMQSNYTSGDYVKPQQYYNDRSGGSGQQHLIGAPVSAQSSSSSPPLVANNLRVLEYAQRALSSPTHMNELMSAVAVNHPLALQIYQTMQHILAQQQQQQQQQQMLQQEQQQQMMLHNSFQTSMQSYANGPTANAYPATTEANVDQHIPPSSMSLTTD